ncbi:DinB family protein [Streptomyces sp. NBC_01387]|uniref:DinB family protein n=1 Tax=unclassified Streptomyces TaxID=2593676 RepID=UPI0020245327|nr:MULTISPECIES: DinB family protein [unclassified Streptomyces]MCX4552425.1 DinB family protein [Streptomyces sp. NBC_01500]WSC23776.1 DinB family protein [Streptomyces sp. NBC_01766]WSV57647.1 DinB family protein [Streptomyces sp. NBC_01014]
MTNPARTEPSITADERPMLEGWLDYHRETLAMKCAGLTDEQLRTAAVPPSELSLLGLVRHMVEVERGWFREVLAGEDTPPLYFSDEDPDGEFHLTAADTWDEAFTTWQAEIAYARELAKGRSLDELSVGESRRGGHFNLRWIYTHMIEEYARHNGHADLIRERIDGVTGE